MNGWLPGYGARHGRLAIAAAKRATGRERRSQTVSCTACDVADRRHHAAAGERPADGSRLVPGRAAPTAGSRWCCTGRAALALILTILTILTVLGGPGTGHAQDRQATGAVPTVSGVRFGTNGEVTRLVIDIDGPSRFATRVLAQPPRLVVDLEAVRWRVQDQTKSRPTGLVNGLNYGNLANGRGRLIVDVERPFRIAREERLPPSGDSPQHRILVDLVALAPARAPPPVAQTVPPGPPQQIGRAGAGDVVVAAPQPVLGPPRARPLRAGSDERLASALGGGSGDDRAAVVLPLPGVDQPSATRLPAASASPSAVEPSAGVAREAPPPPQRRLVIALDAGHGGIDPGTIGINGLYEKDVTLDVARRLRALIEATGRYDVVMTRDEDVLVSLRNRITKARAANAALFISIHADSIGDEQLRGASVYTLSDQASDAEAARLAHKENRADVIAGTDLSAHDDIVAGILIDLAQRVTNNKSIAFAEVLTDELGEVTSLLRNTRRFAGFVVLKSPDIPSVLLELGYLSNPADAANLAAPEYRDRLARATLNAIDRYFAQVDAAL